MSWLPEIAFQMLLRESFIDRKRIIITFYINIVLVKILKKKILTVLNKWLLGMKNCRFYLLYPKQTWNLKRLCFILLFSNSNVSFFHSSLHARFSNNTVIKYYYENRFYSSLLLSYVNTRTHWIQRIFQSSFIVYA